MSNKDLFLKLGRYVLYWVLLQYAIGTTIQEFKCDKMTRAQLFKRSWQNFTFDFIECEPEFKN